MSDLHKAAEALIKHWEAGEFQNCTGYMAGHIGTLRQALAHEALDRMASDNQKLGLYDDATHEVTPEVTPEVTGEVTTEVGVDAAYTKLDTTAGVSHKEWVGLTDEELSLLWLEYHGDNFIADGRIINYEKAIEAKLKEKNVPQP